MSISLNVSLSGIARFLAAIAGMICAFSFASYARTVTDVATMDTVGCTAKADLLDLMRAGRMATGEAPAATAARTAAVMKKKIASGACFAIPAGRSALSAPEWQKPEDMWSGVAVFATKSGQRFYSVSWGWRFVGNVPDFIP